MTKNIKYAVYTILFSLIAIIVLLAMTPPVSRDALTHHLAIPKLYLQYGGIYEIPELIFSYYPMNLDLLYIFPLWLGNDIIPKFIHLFFGLATTWLVYSYIKSRLGLNWALIGALLFLSTPIIIHLTTTAYVDLGVVFFTTAAVLLILNWGQTHRTKILFLSGICAGLAAGTKYNGLITIFLLTCFIPIIAIHNQNNNKSINTTKAAGFAIFFSSCAIITVSPWLIRNFLWTTNPVYPLFQSIFNAEPTSITQGMNPLLIRKLLYNESIWQTLLIPIRIFFEGQDNNPQYFDGVLNPFILLFSIAAFIPSRNLLYDKKDNNLFLWFSILFILFAFVQRVIRIRYITPVLPCLSILSVFGLYNLKSYLLTTKYSRSTKMVPALLLIMALSINGIYLVRYWQRIQPLHYISGQISKTAFISRFWTEYPLIQYSNNNLPPSSTILAVFLGNRGYYFDRTVRFDLESGKSFLCSLVQEQATAKEVAVSLSNNDISHLLIREDLFQHRCHKKLSEEELNRFSQFFSKYTQKIAVTQNHSLFSLATP